MICYFELWIEDNRYQSMDSGRVYGIARERNHLKYYLSKQYIID